MKWMLLFSLTFHPLWTRVSTSAAFLQLGEFSIFFVNGKMTHCLNWKPMQSDANFNIDYDVLRKIEEATDEEYQIAEETLKASRICALGDKHGSYLFARVDFLYDANQKPRVSEGLCFFQVLGNQLVELFEPNLFLTLCPSAATVLAESILQIAKMG